MTKFEYFNERLNTLREELISEILFFIKKEKANEVELRNPVIISSGDDDQFSPNIQRIKADGEITVELSYGDLYDESLQDYNNDILLQILSRLENGKFEVFEEDGGENKEG